MVRLRPKGSVSINGQSITKRNADQIRQTVGLLFDNPDNQLFSPTVEADVSFGPYNLRMKATEVKKLAEDAMKEVGIFDLREKSPYNLSLGQKKRFLMRRSTAKNTQLASNLATRSCAIR